MNNKLYKSIIYQTVFSSGIIILVFFAIQFSIENELRDKEIKTFKSIESVIKEDIGIYLLIGDNAKLKKYMHKIISYYPQLYSIEYSSKGGEHGIVVRDDVRRRNNKLYSHVIHENGETIKIIFISSYKDILSIYNWIPFTIVGLLLLNFFALRKTFRDKLLTPISKVTDTISYYTSDKFKEKKKFIEIDKPNNELDVLIPLTESLYDYQLSRLIYDERLKAEVAEATKSKTAFIASMAHDFKSPLISIEGILDDIESIFLDQNIIHQDRNKKIFNEFSTLRAVINDMEQSTLNIVDYAKLEVTGELTTEIKMMDITHVLVETVSAFSLALEAKNNMVSYKIIGQKFIFVDEKKYRQVLRNVISNANKYSVNSLIHIDVVVTKKGIETFVIDQGKGISKDIEETIFKPFQRVHNDLTEGSGIGLSFSKMVLDKLGGEIVFYNNSDRGATFKFFMPGNIAPTKDVHNSTNVGVYCNNHNFCDFIDGAVIYTKCEKPMHFTDYYTPKDLDTIIIADIDLENSDNELKTFLKGFIKKPGASLIICRTTTPVNSPVINALTLLGSPEICHITRLPIVLQSKLIKELSSKNNQKDCLQTTCSLKILICDDSIIYANLIKKRLTKEGFSNIVIRNNGFEAVSYVSENHIDIVIMDHMMPIMDGITAAKQIKEKSKDTFILGLTAAKNELNRDGSKIMDVVFLKDFKNMSQIINQIKIITQRSNDRF